MEFLNNANIVAGLIASLIAIISAVLVSIRYLLKKVISSQQQTIQLQTSQKQTSYHAVSKPTLSWMDWLLVLWLGLEDSFKAKDGSGWIFAGGFGFMGAFIAFQISLLVFIFFLGLFIIVILVFYTYFVGRRIEEKFKDTD